MTSTPAEDRFDDVAQRLRQERPELTPLELDGLKRRVLQATTGGGTRRPKGASMRTRLALTVMLVLGLVLSSTGATLALSGSTGTSASGFVYRTPDQGPPVLGEEGGGPGGPGGGGGPTETLPPVPGQGTTPTLDGGPVQTTRQVASRGGGNETLPTTGLSAILVMMTGFALVTGGLVLRRRTEAD